MASTSEQDRGAGLEEALDERTEVLREAATMVLYVSVVEIAELATLPEGHFTHGRVTGPVGAQLLAIVWGTAIGLAIAHWFAFRVAAPGFRGDRPTRHDTNIGLAQLGRRGRRRGVERAGPDLVGRPGPGDDRRRPRRHHRRDRLPRRARDREVTAAVRLLRHHRASPASSSPS